MDQLANTEARGAAAESKPAVQKPEAQTLQEQLFLKGVYTKAATLEKNLAERERREAWNRTRRSRALLRYMMGAGRPHASGWGLALGLSGFAGLSLLVLFVCGFSIGAVFGLSILWMSAAAVQEQMLLRAKLNKSATGSVSQWKS